MADPGDFQLCGLAVVHPWLCDAMGHLTTRHYLGMFDDATYQLFTLCGYDAAAASGEGWGWADVRHEIEYKGELKAGAAVKVLGRLTLLGKTSVRSELRLLESSSDRLCSTLKATTVCFDLNERCSRTLPETFASQARRLFSLSGS
jgi:acyl-CoA thioester hydrolase